MILLHGIDPDVFFAGTIYSLYFWAVNAIFFFLAELRIFKSSSTWGFLGLFPPIAFIYGWSHCIRLHIVKIMIGWTIPWLLFGLWLLSLERL